MRWNIGIAPDLWDRDPGCESRFSYHDPDELQDHCVLINVEKNVRYIS